MVKIIKIIYSFYTALVLLVASFFMLAICTPEYKVGMLLSGVDMVLSGVLLLIYGLGNG